MADNKKAKPSGDGPERNSKGQFANGNCGGPGGNRPNAHQRELREALGAAVTKEDIENIMRGQIKLAPRDTQAANFVFSYLYGKPTQQVNLAGEDGGPIKTETTAKIDAEEAIRIARGILDTAGAK